MKISEQAFVENYDKLATKLLDENQAGGAWFYGSDEEFEEWAGEVLFEALEIFLNLCGIEVEWDEIGTEGVDIPQLNGANNRPIFARAAGKLHKNPLQIF